MQYLLYEIIDYHNDYHVIANDTLPSSTPEVTVGMKRCAAYEVTTLAKQKVVMKTNPAYEEVKVLQTH